MDAWVMPFVLSLPTSMLASCAHGPTAVGVSAAKPSGINRPQTRKIAALVALCIATAPCSVQSQSHSCAVSSSGGVSCWGYNYYGQVGDGSTTQRNTPVSVAGLSSGVAMVALGGVRRVCDLCACLMLSRERVCGLFAFLWCNRDHGGLRLREVDFGRCW